MLGLARVVLPVGAGEKQRRVDQPPRWRATLAQRKGRQRSSARALVSAPAAREDEDEEHEAVPRSRLCDEFEPLSRFLGRGGFASVVSARHRLDGREYARRRRPTTVEKFPLIFERLVETVSGEDDRTCKSL